MKSSDIRSAFLKAADIPELALIHRLTWRFWTRQNRLKTPPTGRAFIQSIDPQRFAPDNEEGSGSFGRWGIDAEGLPVYVYDMNQRRDLRAYYINSEGLDRRDHWHQIGNDRLTALASNDGVVQVYLATRGGIFLNHLAAYGGIRPRTLVGYLDALLRFVVRVYGILRGYWVKFRTQNKIMPRGQEAKHLPNQGEPPIIPYAPPENGTEAQEVDSARFAYSGGFGYLNDGSVTWSTAFRYSPEDADTRRVFGIGYFETEMLYRDIHQKRRVYAPYGDDAHLLADVEIENRRQTAVDVHYYEYWDVNVQQMQVQWIRTGVVAPLRDSQRAAINSWFSQEMQLETGSQALRFRQKVRNNHPFDRFPGEIDEAPPDIFLANLSQPIAAYYTDKDEFFGEGGVTQPDCSQFPRASIAEAPNRVDSMPYCMIFRHDLHLEAGASQHLRYAYGAVEPGVPLDLSRYKGAEPFTQTLQSWKDHLLYFSTGCDPVLQREMSWHAYNLLSATLFSQYYNQHYTPQGSAYLYLEGAEGVPRDLCLFAMPMVYIRPDLARQALSLIMSLRNKQTGALPYGFLGHGAQTDALGVHAQPSDLDLFFLLAISEYLAATGDTDFLLNTKVPLYLAPDQDPGKTPGISVLDHIRLAVQHLDSLTDGTRGLLKIGDGDWDDSIVLQTALENVLQVSIDNTKRSGGSIPNSQMAVYVLPLAAAIVEPYDGPLAAHLRDLAANKLAPAVKDQWDAGQGWFHRAILKDYADNDVVIGDHHLSLESQVWPLISGQASEMNVEAQLIETVKTVLDDPSPTGAPVEVKGLIWAAVSQLLTWGYRRSRPDLAWRSLNRNTFAAHATAFPNVWFNLWSGPDSLFCKGAPNAGGTWSSPITPMTDFPVMNANQDAMALLALLRVCGVEPSKRGDGLDIMPKAPPERYALETQLLSLDVASGRIAGSYRAFTNGKCTLHIHLPDGAAAVNATIDGQMLNPGSTSQVDLLLSFAAHQKVAFEVSWQ